MKRVIALGFFDGVHVGHGALLRCARKRADALGCSAVGLTFDPHPDALVFGRKTPLINTLSQRRFLMTELYEMDEMLILPFDREMMELDWQSFVKDMLRDRLKAVHVVCGHDFTFGYKGQGNARNLSAFCQELGLGCDVVEKVELMGETVSSTHIRRLLQQGDVETANLFLGHRHFFSGTVIHGRHLGRKLGFPTANFEMPPQMAVPAHGVYAAWVVLPDGSRHMAVTNIGCRPTVDSSGTVTVESWLLDWDKTLYGQEIRVELCKFLRPEEKFSSLDALTAAIRQDAETARRVLTEH